MKFDPDKDRTVTDEQLYRSARTHNAEGLAKFSTTLKSWPAVPHPRQAELDANRAPPIPD